MRAAFVALGLAACAAAGCATTGEEPLEGTEDDLEIEATARTRKELGVARWGARGNGARETTVRGYDARGRPVVQVRQEVAYGDGTYHVTTTETGVAQARMTLEVADESADTAVSRNDFASKPKARNVLERIQADAAAREKAPGGGAVLTRASLRGASASLRPASELTSGEPVDLVACVAALLTAVETALTSASSCALAVPTGEAPQECASGVQDVISGVQGAKDTCGGGGGEGGEGKGAGSPPGGGGLPSGGGGGSPAGSGTPGEKPPATGAPEPDACVLHASPYSLPVEAGKRVTVSQGNDGKLSHNSPFSRHAFDLDLPRGTPLVAMADGKVVRVRDATKPGMPCHEGGGIACLEKANFVLIRHAGGEDSLYLHLEAARVKPDQVVKRGDVIGTVGSTGHSTGPHAHVQLQTPCEDYVCTTVPLAFADVPNEGVPKSGEAVTACTR